MSKATYTIGELSRLSGLSVRRIRFYSDKGLLAAARSTGGYRVYSDADVARLSLINALRGAGVSLDTIRKILSRRLSLTDVLTMRLETLEAEIAAQRRIAAVLRATLRAPDPTEADLRRLWTVTTISNAQLRAMIERFYDRVTEGARMDDDWRQQMIEAGTPTLPDEPTPEQTDAWTELMAIITDESFIAEMRAETTRMWNANFDPADYADAANHTLARVRAAISAGLTPTSAAGQAIAREWLASSAKAMGRASDTEFLAWQLEHYRKHSARSTRYQQLMAILRGDDPQDPRGSEWYWINEAMKPLLTDAA